MSTPVANPAKFVATVMLESAKALKLTIGDKKPTSKTPPEALATALDDHFKKVLTPDNAVACDNCGAASSDDIDTCPFCGVGDEETAETEDGSDDDSSDDLPESSEEVAEVVTDPAVIAATPAVTAEIVPVPVAEVPAKRRGRPKKEEAIEVLPEGVTVDKLNIKIAEVSSLKGAAAEGMWALGAKIAEIYNGQFWKARQVDGKPAYSGFNKFCDAELGMSPQNAYDLMDVARAFNSDEVRKFGTTKLGLLLKAPPEAQARLKAKIEAGAPVAELRGEVVAEKAKARSEGKSGTKETGRKVRNAGKGKTAKSKDTIAIASMTGTSKVLLFKKPEKRGQPALPATSLDGAPTGVLDLENGVRMKFTLMASPTGELFINVETKRVEKLVKPV